MPGLELPASYFSAGALAFMPQWHYLHIHDDVIPALKRRGVTEEQLTAMLVDNPRRIFSTTGGY